MTQYIWCRQQKQQTNTHTHSHSLTHTHTRGAACGWQFEFAFCCFSHVLALCLRMCVWKQRERKKRVGQSKAQTQAKNVGNARAARQHCSSVTALICISNTFMQFHLVLFIDELCSYVVLGIQKGKFNKVFCWAIICHKIPSSSSSSSNKRQQIVSNKRLLRAASAAGSARCSLRCCAAALAVGSSILSAGTVRALAFAVSWKTRARTVRKVGRRDS